MSASAIAKVSELAACPATSRSDPETTAIPMEMRLTTITDVLISQQQPQQFVAQVRGLATSEGGRGEDMMLCVLTESYYASM